jgi:hypothetical protein
VSNTGTRVHVVRFRGKIENRVDVVNLLQDSGDFLLIERGRPRSVVMLCPCGCGDELTVNLDSRVGPAWSIYESAKGPTLYPSVWRESGCRSHFIVWGGRVYWCDYESLWDATFVEPDLDNKVSDLLGAKGLLHYKDISEHLGEIPWDILIVCRGLVKRGLLREGVGKHKGCFQNR